MTPATPRADVPAIFRARAVRVIDGDTVVFDVDLRFDVTLRVTCRLYGINAPELRGGSAAAGQAAKRHLTDLLLKFAFTDEATPYLLVKSHKAEPDADKYGRWLFEIQGTDGERRLNLNEEMVKAGMAVSYLP